MLSSLKPFSAFILDAQLRKWSLLFATKHTCDGAHLILLLGLALRILNSEDMNSAVVTGGCQESSQLVEGERADDRVFDTAANLLEGSQAAAVLVVIGEK